MKRAIVLIGTLPAKEKSPSWMAAGEVEREAALEQLQTCLTTTTVSALSERALASDSAAQQRFAALLAKAFQFPAANYVYLVGGHPVITFWVLLILTKNLEPMS
ncbi:MAG: hypothetical protein ACR5LC_05765 [Symbiopectobacterium sp.]